MSKIKPKAERHQHPSESIGHELEERRGKTVRVGTAIRFEYTGSTIRNIKTGEAWPGFRFLLRSKSGREWWSTTYPDKSRVSLVKLDSLLVALKSMNKSKAHAASWVGHLQPYIDIVEQLMANHD